MIKGAKKQAMIRGIADRCAEILNHRGNPFEVLYHKPRSMSMVYFAKFAQKYVNYRAYMVLLAAAAATGYEPVPSPLLWCKSKKWAGRRVAVGDIAFYLLRPEEMSRGLKERYQAFKLELEALTQRREQCSKEG